MSVFKDGKTGKWNVRVYYRGKSYRAGTYKTKKEALAVHDKRLQDLKNLEKISIDNLPAKYEPKLIEVDRDIVSKWIRRGRKLQADIARRREERRKDKETKLKLEKM